MQFALDINLDNAAFDGDKSRRAEIARILRDVAMDVEFGGTPDDGKWHVRDINGNTIGECGYKK